MSDPIGGGLWTTFAPLWSQLRAISADLKLAGGYGLFLKQQWLASPLGEDARPLVPLNRWRDGVPRVTKDIDLIVEVGLIASPQSQQHFDTILREQGFEVVPANARWQFERKLEGGTNILVDFHAPRPDQAGNAVKAESRRVKPRPSLGDLGIHGRENPMAVCSDLAPFTFSLGGMEIVLPNPITLALMKLAAVRDQYAIAQDPGKPELERRTASRQAQKHAMDLFRMTAMITREEYDRVPAVLDVAEGSEAFADCQAVFADLFGAADSWGVRAVAPKWEREDVESTRRLLSGWFR